MTSSPVQQQKNQRQQHLNIAPEMVVVVLTFNLECRTLPECNKVNIVIFVFC